METPDPPGDLDAAFDLHRAGDLEAAAAAYGRILDAEPHHADALHLLGILEHQRGRHEAAVDLIDRAVARGRGRADFRNNLGVALKALGRLDEAIAAYHEALRLDPRYADARSNLGTALRLAGQPDRARASFEAALRLDPGHRDALYNLANLLREAGDPGRSVDLYRAALRRDPRHGDALKNLGAALLELGRDDEAIDCLRRAADLDPADADARDHLGTALAGRDRVEEAAEAFAAAARLGPADARWPIRIASLCPAVFPSAAAIDRYRAGLEAVLDAHRAGLRLDPTALAASGLHPPFQLAHHGRDDRVLKAKYAALFRDAFPRRDVAVGAGVPRVGFVATHRREGIFLRCLAGIIDRLEAGRFEVVVFGSARGIDRLRAGIRRPDAEILAIPDRLPEAAGRIAAARCDLLYHWQIGSDALGYFLPFARPAPVQCTSWGTHTTSGVPAVDYYLASAWAEPPGGEARYSEALVRLAGPLTYQVRLPRPGPPATRAEFGLPEGAHLYMCLQRLEKFHPDFDPMLAGILRRDPRGLVVAPADPGAGRLAGRFRATMPDVAGRVAFLPRLGFDAYLRLLSLADAALDPPHFGSGATAYDAFGLDLPLVTLPGPAHLNRYVLGCYGRMGLPDLVADSAECYAELAARLGTDRDYRAAVAGRIAAASPALFEDAAAVREHGRFFERAIATARAGAAPGEATA